jgi:hypothetical protein
VSSISLPIFTSSRFKSKVFSNVWTCFSIALVCFSIARVCWSAKVLAVKSKRACPIFNLVWRSNSSFCLLNCKVVSLNEVKSMPSKPARVFVMPSSASTSPLIMACGRLLIASSCAGSLIVTPTFFRAFWTSRLTFSSSELKALAFSTPKSISISLIEFSNSFMLLSPAERPVFKSTNVLFVNFWKAASISTCKIVSLSFAYWVCKAFTVEALRFKVLVAESVLSFASSCALAKSFLFATSAATIPNLSYWVINAWTVSACVRFNSMLFLSIGTLNLP